jgi:pimeloyl-ACP methyl ester carboxylesterase
MPYVSTNGIRLAYEEHGAGTPVLLVMGTAAGGRVWTMHQTPALKRAGYKAITFDNRGVPPSDVPPGRYSLADMVADTKGVVEALGLAPCRLVGVSLGAVIVQELALHHPELVSCAVLIGTKARSDAVRQAYSLAFQEMAEQGVALPTRYQAVASAYQMLSPATLDDDEVASLWLETFEYFADGERTASGQYWADDFPDRRQDLRRVRAPCRVIAFGDDLVTPPHLAREVADAIPGCDYVEVGAAGHYGYLEQPDEVNAAIVEFLAKNEGT